MPIFRFPGASGLGYAYVLVDLDQPGSITPQAGNYIFAKSAGPPKVVYSGEADNVMHEIASTTLWSEAKLRYGVDLLYVHPQKDHQARITEQADLVAFHSPPMNLTDTASADKG